MKNRTLVLFLIVCMVHIFIAFEPSSEPEVRIMEVTAYCECERCCGKWADGITASGVPADGWLVAASPDIPFGTLLIIPGYAFNNPVPVQDRGGDIKGDKLDVLFPTHQEALNWGRKRLEVTFIE